MTGAEKNGFNADPKFTDFSHNVFHLATGSPAIDDGWTISGLTDGFLGAAPDLGRYEDH